MQISTTFDYNQVQFDKENEVVLMTSFKAPKINPEKERAPLNLSLVLDVSGSMSGKKIEMLKSTVSRLIQQLNDRDTVGIVSFTNFISEVFAPCKMTSLNKSEASKAVSRLVALSSTNMSGGILKGISQLKVSELGKDQVHRILLFTDGQANEGLLSKEEFVGMLKENVSNTPMTVSCFGYGEDHSEDILKSIADEGKGNFYFIKSTEDISKAFARELGGLLSCYAQNITVELNMKENTGKFIEVLNNLDVDSKDEKSIKVTFDDLYSEEEKHLLVKVHLNSVTKAVTQRASSVIKGTVKFNDMTCSGKEKVLDISSKIKFVKAEDVQKESTLSVLEQLGLIELAKKLEEAKKFADGGLFSKGVHTLVPGIYTQQLISRCSEIGGFIKTNLDETSNLMNSSTYSTSVGNNISGCARGLNMYRSVNTTSNLYVNSSQKDMEDKFKDLSEDSNNLDDQLNVDIVNNGTFGQTLLGGIFTNLGKSDVDIITSNTITLNSGGQIGPNGLSNISSTGNTTLSKRRSC